VFSKNLSLLSTCRHIHHETALLPYMLTTWVCRSIAGLDSLEKFTPAQRAAVRVLEMHMLWGYCDGIWTYSDRLTWPVGLVAVRYTKGSLDYQGREELPGLKKLVVKVEDQS
jgi:hypothetical protein